MLLIFLGYDDDALEFLCYCFIVFLVLPYILTRGGVLNSNVVVARGVHTSITVIILLIPAAAAFKGGTAYPTLSMTSRRILDPL